MNFLMKYKNEDIMELDLIVMPDAIKVEQFHILKKELLPWVLKYAFSKEKIVSCQNFIVAEWLMNRAVPDSRINLDEFLLSLYQLKRHLFGRMYGYQYTAALLSYFASYFDNYIIVPVRPVNICFIYLDGRFTNLYRLYPPGDDYFKNILINPNSNIDTYIYKKVETYPKYDGAFHTLSFTISSNLPSWWELDGSQKILKQECFNNKNQLEANLFADIVRKADLREYLICDEKIIKTDFSFLAGVDTIWIGGLGDTSFLNQNNMIENLKSEFRKTYEIEQLLEIQIKMKEAGYYIRNQNLGIAYKKNKFYAIAII